MITSCFRRGLPAWVLMPCLLIGCGPNGWRWKDKPATQPSGTLDDAAAPSDQPQSVAMQGTVGAVAYPQGTRFMRVRGYGLVAGLNGQGSRSCPPDIRDYLIREIRRSHSAKGESESLTAEQLIDSLDTAVVEVTGEIRAGAPKGSTFDVFVSASAISPNTRSLAGGYLMPCDLKIFREVAPTEVIEGRTHAKSRGAIFINPFSQSADSAAGVTPLEGKIIGGGVNLIDRRLSLIAAIESYSTVRQVMDAINQRFDTNPKTADATTPTNIALTIPATWRGQESRFLELVLHLPVSASPAAREARAKALVGELARPGLLPTGAALALEGIGSSVIPMVQELYTHPRRQVNYYAAQTGLRLGDEPAAEIIIRHARDPRSPFRLQAIQELGDCAMRARAGAALRELLADPDPQIRIRAYEALRIANRDLIFTAPVGRDPGNFILDIVPSKGEPLIYARRTMIRRIALIGAEQMAIRPPLVYAKPDKQVTLSAQAGDDRMTVLRKESGSIVGEFKVPLSVLLLTRFLGDDPSLDANGQPRGLGLDYAVVLDVLHHLCETGAINADMKWEEQTVEDLIGPLRPMGRPESEL